MQIRTLSKLLILILATAMQTTSYAEEHFRGERDHEERGHEFRDREMRGHDYSSPPPPPAGSPSVPPGY